MSEEPYSPRSMHRAVAEAVHMMWNNEYDMAENILSRRRNENPRYALEYANIFLVKGLSMSSNESREALLPLFKESDNLATATRYGEAMVSDSDDYASPKDDETMTDSEKASFEKYRKKEQEREREKAKALFKERQKTAVSAGESVEQLWKLECDVIYADSLLIRSLVQLMTNSYFKGGINLRKTWGCYYALIQEVMKDNGQTIPRELEMCIKYGCGTFYIYLALVPAGLMKVLSAIGFLADKELGEQYLTEVFRSDSIRSPFAALVLCTYYLFLPTGLGRVEDTLSKVKVILDRMNECYPNNTYFHGYANFYHRKKGETDEALQAIIRATTNATKAGVVPLLLQYLHADTLFMDLQFENAKQQYLVVLDHLAKTKETFAYTGQVVLSLAACYVMLGDRDTAVSWIKKIQKMYNPKSKNDANSPKYAAKVLSDMTLLPMIGVYILYINRDLAHMTEANAERTLEQLKDVTTGCDLSGVEAQSMYNLFVGVIHKGCGRTEEAKVELERIFATAKKLPSNSMVLPFTYYEYAELEYRRGNHAAAMDHFEKGQSCKGEMSDTLKNRFEIAMKQLKKIMKGQK